MPKGPADRQTPACLSFFDAAVDRLKTAVDIPGLDAAPPRDLITFTLIPGLELGGRG